MVKESSLLQVAIMAAIEAGKAILEIYTTDFDVVLKPDHSPITKADKIANALIFKHLKSTHIPIISEESQQQPFSERQHWDTCWIVDPLDGTKEFINRNGDFTVNIALVKQQKPVLGVIYIPVTQTLYFTAADAQSVCKHQLKTTIFSAESILKAAFEVKPCFVGDTLKILASRSHLNKETERYIETLKESGEVRIVQRGSSLKFCSIVEGEGHVYPRFSPTMEWDTAAGHALCSAVGIEVINQETEKPLLYNKENLYNPNFVVSTLPL